MFPPDTLLRALRHRPYRRWALAGAVSVIGTWLQIAAQGWLVLQLGGSGTALGLTVSLQALPGLLLGPWAGSLADRVSRRDIVLVSQLVLVALALVQAGLAWSGHLSAWTLLAIAPLTGIVLAVESPAQGALGASLVPDEDLPNALALGSITHSLGRIAGVAAAGIVVAVAGAGGAFFVNALSFLPVVFVLARLTEPPRVPVVEGDDRADVRIAARHLRRPDLARTLGLSVILGSLGRNYQVTMAVMAATVYGSGSGGYATLSTAFAIGALVGGVAAARLRRLGPHAVVVAGGLGAVLQLASAAAPSLAAFAVAVVGAAVAAVVFDTSVSAHLQASSPDALRGRVLGLVGVASAAAGVVGGTAVGWLAEHLGGRGALAIGGSICVLAVLSAAPGMVDVPARLRAWRPAPSPA